ncbi:MAG: DUF4197 domain-containing protein [Bacteroidota bacterium]
MKRIIILSLSLSLFVFTSCKELLQVVETVATSTEPSLGEMSSGLKEALTKGAAFAVQTLNKEGGYFNDPLVKIPFPQEAQFAANALRDIGLGSVVDNFEKKLNEGAEKGAALALPIFKNAIREMTFADVKNILLGGENAATNYFREKTLTQLSSAFTPHVKNSLDEVNATQLWTDLTTRYNRIPLVRKKVETDIVKYATGKALNGLFLKLADEEKKIRENPIARTSDLLKKVFGYADQQQSGNG